MEAASEKWPANTACHQCCAQRPTSWPLCFNRRLLVHICELDPAVLRPGDFYFVVGVVSSDTRSPLPAAAHHLPERPSTRLLVKYRDHLGHLGSKYLDVRGPGTLSTMDWMARGDENCSDEQLVTVLKHLLVSVERGLERIEWDSLLAGRKAWTCEHRLKSHCGCKASGSPQPAADMRNSAGQASATATPEQQNKEPACELCGCAKQDSVDCASRRTSASSGIEAGPSSDSDYSLRSRECSLTGVLPPDGLSALFREGTSLSREEEQDDGYYDNTLSQPTSMSQLDHKLLLSRVACLPGCRDVDGRGVVIVSSSAFRELPDLTPSQLAQMLMYFCTIPKKENGVHSFLVLVNAAEATDELWTTLDEAFSLLEVELAASEEKLLKFVKKDNLLPEFGGTYAYDHQEWMSFRKFLEPFVSGCRLSGRQLVSVMQELRTGRVPPSSALAQQLIEAQKRHIQDTFRDEQLRHLQEEGDTILQELQAYRSRDALEKSALLYSELKRAMTKLTKLADKRLQRLQECMLARTFEEESSQVS
ncbi:hypothetical protein IscW_ISCW021423 [Ixodes scapularis]|uniref:Uncharacterized protein n=1 Tax=Ixodes scapularis TaxID=6945 RepID=B7Q624_IXOSC|nr:hypothetical protein IscW_ISCW021423 [Ixodes scapularis]|eukprot:XP_002411871.1 hypothetical protein IscW_ISCW021423 [Ixodes scapularis]